MISRRVWIALGIVVAVYAVVLATDLTPYVRGPDEWRWARYATLQWDRALPVLGALALIGTGVAWIDRRARHSPRPQRWIGIGVLALVLTAPIVQLLALRTERLNPFEALFDRAVDVAANGYFTVGHQITDPGDFLRRYPDLMPTFPIHPQVHPPGIPLAYWLTGSALESVPPLAKALGQLLRPIECNDINLMLLSDARLSSASVGMFVPMLANMLTVWCVFKLAQARFGSRAGLYASALWVGVPSAVLFPGSWSQVYPAMACAVWLAVDTGLARRRIWPFFAAGLALSIATFMELGAAALALFLALYAVAQYAVERRNPLRDWRFLGMALAASLAGVFSLWLGYQIGYGVDLARVVNAMWPIHTGYIFDRVVWMMNHPYEYIVFTGLPIAGLFALASLRAIGAARRGERADALSLTFGAGIVILSLIDPARDETPRTWMLLMPFAVVVASQWLVAESARPMRFGGVWALLAVQVIVMVATLRPVETGLYGAPPRPTPAALPADASALWADFSGFARLVGYHLARPDASHVTLDLFWQATDPIDHPYVVFSHLVDDRNQIVGQHDARPHGGEPLMTCWQPGDVYPDRHEIVLTPDAAGRAVTIDVGLYNGVTGTRVPVIGPDGQATDHVVLQTISASPPAGNK